MTSSLLGSEVTVLDDVHPVDDGDSGRCDRLILGHLLESDRGRGIGGLGNRIHQGRAERAGPEEVRARRRIPGRAIDLPRDEGAERIPRAVLLGCQKRGSQQGTADLLGEEVDSISRVILECGGRGRVQLGGRSAPVSRTGPRTFPIVPCDIRSVFPDRYILFLAYSAQTTLGVSDPEDKGATRRIAVARRARRAVRSVDVLAYLKQELEYAYDMISRSTTTKPGIIQDVGAIEGLTDGVYDRGYDKLRGVVSGEDAEDNQFVPLYGGFTCRLPGIVQWRPAGVLPWAIASRTGWRQGLASRRDSIGGHRGSDDKFAQGRRDVIEPSEHNRE